MTSESGSWVQAKAQEEFHAPEPEVFVKAGHLGRGTHFPNQRTSPSRIQDVNHFPMTDSPQGLGSPAGVHSGTFRRRRSTALFELEFSPRGDCTRCSTRVPWPVYCFNYLTGRLGNFNALTRGIRECGCSRHCPDLRQEAGTNQETPDKSNGFGYEKPPFLKEVSDIDNRLCAAAESRSPCCGHHVDEQRRRQLERGRQLVAKFRARRE